VLAAVVLIGLAAMTSRGWSRRSFNLGDAVTVSLKSGKDGVPVGLITTVVLPNGQTLYAVARRQPHVRPRSSDRTRRC